MSNNPNKIVLTSQNINEQRNAVIRLLRDSRVYEALQLVHTLVNESANAKLHDNYNSVSDSYKYLLEYLSQGFEDPNKQSRLNDIIESIYTLTDKTTMDLLSKCSSNLFYIRYNNRISDIAEAMQKYRDINDAITFNNADTATDPEQISNLYKERERVEKDLFHYFWTSFPLTTDDTKLLKQILLEEGFVPQYLQNITIGAILLSLLNFYDEAKLFLLLDTYEHSSDLADKASQEIALHAIVCFVIALFRHNRRASISKPLKERLALLSEQNVFKKDLSCIFIDLVREKNAETLSKSLQDSIIPDIMKIAPEIIENAKKGNGVIDISSLEENPEWFNMFDKSGLSKKLEEFAKLQTSGTDVFLSTFAHLKNYPFFKELYNWFRPYHTDNSVLANAYSKMKPSVKSLISGMTYLCDNDKYSFVLSLSELDDSQRELMLQQFDMRGNDLSERQGEFDTSKLREDIINNYIKDMYRFFNIFSRRSEFANVFQSSLDLISVDLLKEHFNSASLINTIAEIYFKVKDYKSAIIYFERIESLGDDISPVYLQKLGFAYQNIGKTDKALSCYLKYFLANESDVWNLKHIATCYRELNQPAEAIGYLQKALIVQPNNTSVSLTIGHCYSEMCEYDSALKEYYKVEYLDTKRHSAWRPLAWCLLMTHDYEQSRKYYTQIISNDTPGENDYLNFGHLCLVQNRFDEAMSYYYSCYSALGNNLQSFADKWRNDIHNLQRAGLTTESPLLLLDAIMMKLTQK